MSVVEFRANAVADVRPNRSRPNRSRADVEKLEKMWNIATKFVEDFDSKKNAADSKANAATEQFKADYRTLNSLLDSIEKVKTDKTSRQMVAFSTARPLESVSLTFQDELAKAMQRLGIMVV
jgi:hypothetical protein